MASPTTRPPALGSQQYSRLHTEGSLPLGLFKQLQRLEGETQHANTTGGNHSAKNQRWLLPYADMLTGLFVVMLILYAHAYQQWQLTHIQLQRYQAAYSQLYAQINEAPSTPPTSKGKITSLLPSPQKNTSH